VGIRSALPRSSLPVWLTVQSGSVVIRVTAESILRRAAALLIDLGKDQAWSVLEKIR